MSARPCLFLVGLCLLINVVISDRGKYFWEDGFELVVLNPELASKLLNEKLKNAETPFIVGRLGAAEACLVSQYVLRTLYPAPLMPCKEPHRDSGIYPETPEGLLEFATIYANALRTLTAGDIMASLHHTFHQEKMLLSGRGFTIVHQRTLMPFTFPHPWSQQLKGKTVLIVHSFKASIECQLRRRGRLWRDKRVLPEFTAKLVKMPQALGNSTPHGSYKETLESVYEQIEAAYPFDVALVAAGAYGMPIAVRIRSKNATAIVMGGASQILFGLKGKRWDTIKISRKYTQDWMYPLQEDMPPGHRLIEDKGPYWGTDGPLECPSG